MRQKQGRDEEPSAAVIDSQSIKTSAVRGPEKGIDMGKKSGDAKGTPSSIQKAISWKSGSRLRVTPTEPAARSCLSRGSELFPRLKLLWGDSHYGGSLIEWVKEHLGWNIQVVHRLGTASDVSTMEPNPATKPSKPGFQPLPRRWVAERSFAWITRWRRLCRDHEGLPASSEAFIKLSASRRMFSRLAPTFP